MKTLKYTLMPTLLLVLALAFLSGCTSMTMIQTEPSGAKIYVNDEYSGQTPFTLSDNKIIGTTTALRFEKEGYKSFTTFVQRTEELDAAPIVCGFIFTPIWWLWAMKYKPVHTYELSPAER